MYVCSGLYHDQLDPSCLQATILAQSGSVRLLRQMLSHCMAHVNLLFTVIDIVRRLQYHTAWCAYEMCLYS